MNKVNTTVSWGGEIKPTFWLTLRWKGMCCGAACQCRCSSSPQLDVFEQDPHEKRAADATPVTHQSELLDETECGMCVCVS